MKKLTILTVMVFFITLNGFSQVAINKDGSAPDSNAILHVKGSNGNFFFISDSTGKVGIETLNPEAKLQVGSNVNTLSVYEDLSSDWIDNDQDGITDEADEHAFLFGVGGSETKVGIGTSSPEAKLQVGSGVNALTVYDDLSTDGIDNDQDGITDESDEHAYLFGVGGSETNIGIGTSNPEAKLQVGSSVTALNVFENLSFDGIDNDQDGITDEADEGNYKLGVGTVGNVGIGTATPGELLDVAGAMHLKPGSAPSTPDEGDIYMDSTTHKLRCYDGTTWHDLW